MDHECESWLSLNYPFLVLAQKADDIGKIDTAFNTICVHLDALCTRGKFDAIEDMIDHIDLKTLSNTIILALLTSISLSLVSAPSHNRRDFCERCRLEIVSRQYSDHSVHHADNLYRGLV